MALNASGKSLNTNSLAHKLSRCMLLMMMIVVFFVVCEIRQRQCNNRIVVFDGQTLTRARALPNIPVTERQRGQQVPAAAAAAVTSTRSPLQLPGAVCVDELRCRLYVGEWVRGRILAYDQLDRLSLGVPD